MYDYFTAHDTGLYNFIYHAWAVLTATISAATDFWAAKNTQIWTVKLVSSLNCSRLIPDTHFCACIFLKHVIQTPEKTCSDVLPWPLWWCVIYDLYFDSSLILRISKEMPSWPTKGDPVAKELRLGAKLIKISIFLEAFNKFEWGMLF